METTQPHAGLATSDCSLECWAAHVTAAKRLSDSKMEHPEEPRRNCATALLAREGPDF